MPVASSGLPVLTFDEASIPAEYQFEVFHDTTAPVFDTRPLSRTDPTHACAVDYLVDHIVVSRLRYGSQLLRRMVSHTQVAGDCVAVQLYDRGGLRGRIGDDVTLDLDQDHIAIVDLAYPFTCWSGDSDVIWVTIPRARLGAGVWPRGAAVVNFHRRSPRGRVLTAAVEHLWAEVVIAPASRAETLAAGIIDTVRRLLRPGDFAPDDSSLMLAMKDHIAANLDDLDLGPDALRATFYCSRTALYRLFQADGGVVAYIRNQRLLRCFDELSAPQSVTRSIVSIATAWGFENPSHFHRLFKAKFGLPPSMVVPRTDDPALRGTSSSLASAEIARFHSWAAAL